MNFKKKRRQKTINKNDEKVRRLQAIQDRPAMSVLYSEVERLSVQMDFYSPQGHLLLQQTREFNPSDTIDFAAPCPGRCGDGRMDLEGKLVSMIQRHETSSQSRAQCGQTFTAGSSDLCGCELRCNIDISYRN